MGDVGLHLLRHRAGVVVVGLLRLGGDEAGGGGRVGAAGAGVVIRVVVGGHLVRAGHAAGHGLWVHVLLAQRAVLASLPPLAQLLVTCSTHTCINVVLNGAITCSTHTGINVVLNGAITYSTSHRYKRVT